MLKNKRVSNAKVAVAYIRSSKASQKLTPQAQRHSIEVWAAREGVEVVSWHEDLDVCSVEELSGRPALTAAFEDIKLFGAGILVVAKRDRIARKPALTNAFEALAAAQGAVIISATGEGNGDTPADEFMRGIIDVAAQYERSVLRARTKAALAVKRARFERVGRVRYGFSLAEDGVHLIPSAAEQATIARAKELAAGAKPLVAVKLGRRTSSLSFRAIATKLAAEGYVGRTGRPFEATQVSRMLADEA
jgi:DNA invertase Pin-like site-specific DNA recombinase